MGDPPHPCLADRGLGAVPALAWRLDRAAEARAGGDPELADQPGGVALHRLRDLLHPRPATDHPPPRSAGSATTPRCRRTPTAPATKAWSCARWRRPPAGLRPAPRATCACWSTAAATYAALLEAIAQARDHVHLEYYIYNPDRTGTALRDALVERARAGVKVRLLVDAVGSMQCGQRFFEPLVRGRRRTGLVPSGAAVGCLEAAVAEPAHAPQDRGHRRPGRLHRRHQHHRRGGRAPARRCLPRPAPARRRRHRALAAGGVRRGLGVCHRTQGLHRRRGARDAARRNRARSTPSCWCRARIRRGRRSTAPARRRDPLGDAADLADHAVLRSRRGGDDGADLGRAGRPGRAPAGAEDAATAGW